MPEHASPTPTVVLPRTVRTQQIRPDLYAYTYSDGRSALSVGSAGCTTTLSLSPHDGAALAAFLAPPHQTVAA